MTQGLNVRITNAFGQYVGSVDLQTNKSKWDLFSQQYLRAVLDSQGTIQGVIDGVIVHLDCPPMLPNIGEIPDPTPPRSVPVRTPFESPNRISTDFEVGTDLLACNQVVGTIQFIPVTHPDELMRIGGTGAVVGEEPDRASPTDAVSLYCVRILNTVYKEVFDLFRSRVRMSGTRGTDKYALSIPERWRIIIKNGKLFLALPPNTRPPKEFVDVYAITLADETVLVVPMWKGFDPLGRMQVRPLSTGLPAILREEESQTVSQVVALIGLHCPIGLIEAVTNLAVDAKDTSRNGLKAILTNSGHVSSSLPVDGGSSVDPIVDAVIGSLPLSSEQLAIVRAVADWFAPSTPSPPCVLVHGVFGSGKSSLLAACVVLACRLLAESGDKRGKVLFLAATNVAVDTILLKILNIFQFSDFVRIGVLDRIHPDIKSFFRRSGGKLTGRLVAATATAAADVDISCPIVFIDEAAQLTEVAALLPLIKCRPVHVLMVGDTHQLTQTGTEHISPSVLAAFTGRASGGPMIQQMHMWTQYRCPPEIASMCSDLFYGGNVITGLSTKLRAAALPRRPVIGIAVHDFRASRGSLASLGNSDECDLILRLLESRRAEWEGKHVCIVSFYNAQVRHIQEAVQLCGWLQDTRVSVHSVDSFQGGEADVVVLSVVASDAARSGDFIANPNRLNVALSRARETLMVVGHRNVWDKIDVYTQIRLRGTELN